MRIKRLSTLIIILTAILCTETVLAATPNGSISSKNLSDTSSLAYQKKQVSINAPSSNQISQNRSSSGNSVSSDDIDLSDYSETGIPYRRFEELTLSFDQTLRESAPEFYQPGEYFSQGVNQYGYKGTCSEAAEATIMNMLFDTNVYTENVFVDCAVKSGLCEMAGNENMNGGQSPIQMKMVLEKVGNYTGDKVSVNYLVLAQDMPQPEEIDLLIANGYGVIMSVDSYILWDMTVEEAASFGISNYYDSNHWIVIKSALRNDNGDIAGFYIVDSSGYNTAYVPIQKYMLMVYGPTGTEIKYPACVLVNKKELSKDEIIEFRDKVNGTINNNSASTNSASTNSASDDAARKSATDNA